MKVDQARHESAALKVNNNVGIRTACRPANRENPAVFERDGRVIYLAPVSDDEMTSDQGRAHDRSFHLLLA
jgi:hypothetical protein